VNAPRSARSFLAAALLALPMLAPSSASALVSPAQPIDGPSPEIVDLGGVAMAPDGSGGLVYRKRVDGRSHIFVSRLVDGAWAPAQRVDVGQRFDSSWPVIGAGDGGRLVVTWVQEFGSNSDRLYYATLDPGASRFQGPLVLDGNVGEATSTFPSLAMNGSGQAYLAYRAPTGTGTNPGFPPGYVDFDVRVARFDGAFWSVLGALADRNPAAPVRPSTAANAPRAGIDVSGSGIVAFQEPDDELTDRIWARRIFGQTLGIPLLVSPQTWGGKPLRGGADAFSLDEAGFGQSAIAFRQQPGSNSGLPGPRVMVATIPESFVPEAAKFGAPRLSDGGGAGALPGQPSAPSVGVTPTGAFLNAYGVGNASIVAGGTDDGLGPAERLDDGATAVPGDPRVVIGSTGAAVVAWKVRSGGRGAAAVQERGADGVLNVKAVSAQQGGPVGDLELAGSRLGDAAVAFLQGNADALAVVASVVDAPPAAFVVQTPIDFTNDERIPVTWDPAANGIGRVTYSVVVDDEVVAEGLRTTQVRLGPDELDDGVHTVRVIARDPREQETTSDAAEVQVDRRAPRVRIAQKRKGARRVTVTVQDGRAREVSGLVLSGTSISVKGARTYKGRRRVTYAFPRPGSYLLTVRARDRAGNRTKLRRRVKVTR
jgi:hypothetical protein